VGTCVRVAGPGSLQRAFVCETLIQKGPGSSTPTFRIDVHAAARASDSTSGNTSSDRPREYPVRASLTVSGAVDSRTSSNEGNRAQRRLAASSSLRCCRDSD